MKNQLFSLGETEMGGGSKKNILKNGGPGRRRGTRGC
jgi:hypothetical protein